MPIRRKPITPKTPLRARKAFKINGRPISAGSPFDWTRLAVSWRRVRLLYEGGFVVADGRAAAPKESAVAQKEAADTATSEAAATEQAGPVEAAEGAPAERAVEVHRRGGGWYDVLVDGEPANESGLRKDDAEAMAEGLRARAPATEDLLS